jgi:hypothetical protein
MAETKKPPIRVTVEKAIHVNCTGCSAMNNALDCANLLNRSSNIGCRWKIIPTPKRPKAGRAQ